MDPDMHGISPASRFLFALLPRSGSVLSNRGLSRSPLRYTLTRTHALFSCSFLSALAGTVHCIARSLASSSPGLPGASSRLILTQILYLFESHSPNLTFTALYSPVPWPVKRQATNPMPSPFVRPIGRLPSIHTTSKIADSCSRHMHMPLLKAPRLVLVAPPTNKVTRGHPQTQRHYRVRDPERSRSHVPVSLSPFRSDKLSLSIVTLPL